LVMLAHLRRRWSLSGREGLGSSLPPAERASAGFRRFQGYEMPIFHYAGSQKKKRERTEVTMVTGRCTGRGHGPVVQGAYWTPTGRGYCGVRSVLQRVRSLVRFVRLSADRRVWSVTGPARPVVTSASGRCDRRVRSVFQKYRCATGASGQCCETSRCATGVSGQLDQRVRSTRFQLFKVSNGYIRRGTSINTRWTAQGSLSRTFDILVSTLS
jgi:hypothetical protein